MQKMSPQQQVQTLQQAIAVMNQGNFAGAERMACDVLAVNPRSHDACTLLGLIWMNGGELDRAEKQIEASLGIQKEQPGAYNVLGSIHRKMGRFSDAAGDYREAVRLAPQFGEAWYNLGLAEKDSGNVREAEKAFKEAIRIERDYPQARNALGILYRENKDLDAAERQFKQVLKSNPRDVIALYHLGVTYREKGDHDAALTQLNEALAINPALVQAFYVKAGVQKDIGANDAAIRTLRECIKVSPEYIEAHNELNKMLWELKREDEFLKSYDEAIQRVPTSANLRFNQAELMMRTDDFEGAKEKLTIAVARAPDQVYILDGMGRCLTRLGDHEDALTYHNRAINLQRDNNLLLLNRAATLMHLGRFDEAVRDMEAMDIEREHGVDLEQLRIAMIAQSYAEVGDPRGQIYNDYERFVQKRPLPVPEGYSSIEAFNKDLLVELERLHVFHQQPLDQSLRANGTQTPGHIFDDPSPVIQKLRQSLVKNFKGYIADLDEDRNHPFLKRKGKKIGFTGGWSVRLRNQGFHASHIHSEGWISSAYYVSLPPEMGGAEGASDPKAGFIHFGRPNLLPGEDGEPDFWIEPEEGFQAMFPSYVWHGTQPFTSELPRVTVAMDVTAD